jgi:hypothetical protein
MTKKVLYFIAKKGMVKFYEDNEKYNLSKELMDKGDFITNPINKGDVVEITAEKDIITSLKKVDGVVEEKKVEIKEEKTTEIKEEVVKPVEEAVVKEAIEEQVVEKEVEEKKEVKKTKGIYTIAGVYEDKRCFTEGKINDCKWLSFSKFGTKEELIEKKLLANVKVEIEVEDNVVQHYRIIEQPKEEKVEEKKPVTQKTDTNSSIEKQVSLKEAGAIVRSLIESSNTPLITSEVKELLTELTKTAYEALTNL